MYGVYYSCCDRNNFKNLKGLSVRSSNCMVASGLLSKEEIVSFLESNGHKDLKGITNLGKVSYKEIIEWCGVSEPEKEPCKNLGVGRAIDLLLSKGYRIEKDGE